MVGGSIFSTYTLYIAITTIEPNATLDSFRGDWPHIIFIIIISSSSIIININIINVQTRPDATLCHIPFPASCIHV